MVTALSQLHHFPTIIASFPALLFAKLENSLCAFIIVAFTSAMPFHIAFFADFRLAFFALANFSASYLVLPNVLWFYPNAAAFLGAVQTILGSIFCEFPVPEDFEFEIEELVDVI